MEDHEIKTGERLMAIISASRALAEDSSGMLTEEERGMCLQAATEFSHMLGRKIKESRTRMREEVASGKDKMTALSPVYTANKPNTAIKSPIVR